MEVVTAMRRLGYIDKPGQGDHIDLYYKIEHPRGTVTLRTGVDMGKNPCTKHVISSVQRQTHLRGTLWKKALDKKLPAQEYREHLLSMKLEDLVPPYYRETVRKRLAGDQGSKPAKD